MILLGCLFQLGCAVAHLGEKTGPSDPLQAAATGEASSWEGNHLGKEAIARLPNTPISCSLRHGD